MSANDKTQPTIADELEHIASGALATAAGLFRAIMTLIDETAGDDNAFAVAQAGVLLAEKGLADIDRATMDYRAAHRAELAAA